MEVSSLKEAIKINSKPQQVATQQLSTTNMGIRRKTNSETAQNKRLIKVLNFNNSLECESHTVRKNLMKTFLLSLFATFFMAILLQFFWSRSLSEKYPDLSNGDILNDTIADIILDGRASARITLNNRKRHTLPWAKNSQYQKELSLPQMIKISDILIKKASSDTIILIQDKKRYTFVANKSI